jgi:hypothetical protein
MEKQQEKEFKLDAVAHAYTPSYSGSSRPARAKLATPSIS